MFTGLAAFGAAAVVFGMSSTLLAATTTAGPALAFPLAGAVVAGLWALALVWAGISSLRGGWQSWPRWTKALLPVATAVQLAALVIELWQLPLAHRVFDLADACAIVLQLAILGSLGWLRRSAAVTAESTSSGAVPAKAVRPGLLLLGAFAAAVAVAAVATPGMAASTAGQHAVPHGEHGSHTQISDPAQHNH
ncbi:MAG: hypothetical protein ACHP7K_01945 [Actinomycetales bacterium]